MNGQQGDQIPADCSDCSAKPNNNNVHIRLFPIRTTVRHRTYPLLRDPIMGDQIISFLQYVLFIGYLMRRIMMNHIRDPILISSI